MNEVFADTCGWANALVKTERFHVEASILMTQWQQQNRCVVTTNYVLSELVALFTRFRISRLTVLNYIEIIRSSAWVEIVHIDESLDKEAWELLANRRDKEWSLVDAASFVVMQKRNITEALTADHHFEQANFIPLLK